MKQDYAQMLRDYLNLFWRQKIWIILPLLCGIMAATALVVYLPKKYRSNTLILVEAQKIPQSYVQSPVSGTVEERLSTIQQQILSRSLLQKTIDKLNLYKGLSEKISSEEMINRMRSDIEIKTIGTKSVEAFSLSFQAQDPVIAMNVTNELASLFIQENLKIREQLVEGASEFLDSELTSLKQTLERQENQIGDFKRLNMGSLPSQLETNLRALDRFQSDMLATQLAKKSAEERSAVLEKTLEMARQRLKEEEAAAAAAGTPIEFSEVPPSPLELELLKKKESLTALSREYKETYPDIMMLKRQITELEAQIAAASPPLAAPLQRNVPVERGKRGLFDRDREYIADLQKQIQTTRLEIKGLGEREKGLQHQIRIHEARVEQVPMREQELATLLRDYENTKKNYEALLDKKLNAKVAENLEKRQKGERFRILDSANLPEKPYFPDPVRIHLAGVALGLGAGIGLVLMRQRLDSTLSRPEEIEKITSVAVLASIPDFTEEMAHFEKERRKVLAQAEHLDG